MKRGGAQPPTVDLLPVFPSRQGGGGGPSTKGSAAVFLVGGGSGPSTKGSAAVFLVGRVLVVVPAQRAVQLCS